MRLFLHFICTVTHSTQHIALVSVLHCLISSASAVDNFCQDFKCAKGLILSNNGSTSHYKDGNAADGLTHGCTEGCKLGITINCDIDSFYMPKDSKDYGKCTSEDVPTAATEKYSEKKVTEKKFWCNQKTQDLNHRQAHFTIEVFTRLIQASNFTHCDIKPIRDKIAEWEDDASLCWTDMHGAIVGGIIGSVFVLLIIACFALYICIRCLSPNDKKTKAELDKKMGFTK